MVTQTAKISLLLNNQLVQHRAYKIYCFLKVSLRMHSAQTQLQNAQQCEYQSYDWQIFLLSD